MPGANLERKAMKVVRVRIVNHHSEVMVNGYNYSSHSLDIVFLINDV